MKLGIGPLACRRPEGTATEMVPVYEYALERAQLAADVGFDSAWVAEHHFAQDGYLSSPVSLCGAIAARTSDFDVGMGLAVAPLHEPIKLAEDAAAINLLARSGGGSFTLGLGLGYRDVEYRVFGVDRRERVGWLLDTVATCRAAWAEGSMSVDGHLVSYEDVDVTPKPGPGTSIVVGANASQGIARAARVADGYIAPPPSTPADVEAAADTIRDELAGREVDPTEFHVASMQYAAVHPDGREAAWEAVREAYLYTRKTYLEYFVESADSDLDLSERELEESVERYADRWREDLLHGTPGEVAEQLRAYRDVWPGPVLTTIQLHYPGLDPDVSRRAVELVGDEVIPVV